MNKSKAIIRLKSHRITRLPSEQQRSGAAMIECAVTLPVLLILVLGMLEIGTALRASTILQSACRECGSILTMDWRNIVPAGQTPNEKIEQDLKNYVKASGLPGDDLIISVVHADGNNAGQAFDLSDFDNDLQLAKIEIRLPYSSVSLFPIRYLSGQSLRAFIVMRAAVSGGTLSE